MRYYVPSLGLGEPDRVAASRKPVAKPLASLLPAEFVAHEHVPAVVLSQSNPSVWETWFEAIEKTARVLSQWVYCNPFSESLLAPPAAPPPLMEGVSLLDPNPQCTSVQQLHAAFPGLSPCRTPSSRHDLYTRHAEHAERLARIIECAVDRPLYLRLLRDQCVSPRQLLHALAMLFEPESVPEKVQLFRPVARPKPGQPEMEMVEEIDYQKERASSPDAESPLDLDSDDDDFNAYYTGCLPPLSPLLPAGYRARSASAVHHTPEAPRPDTPCPEDEHQLLSPVSVADSPASTTSRTSVSSAMSTLSSLSSARSFRTTHTSPPVPADMDMDMEKF